VLSRRLRRTKRRRLRVAKLLWAPERVTGTTERTNTRRGRGQGPKFAKASVSVHASTAPQLRSTSLRSSFLAHRAAI